MSSTQRRRPATRKGRPVLTREAIAATALRMAGVHGFPAVTMRALAAELDVTVRAIYNYVEDRRQVVELATGLMLDSWRPPPLQAATWERSLADYAHSLRELYRRWPRALLIAVDEDAPPASVHPHRLTNVDRFLQLLRDVGLSVPDALAVHRHLSLQLLAFALVVDHLADRAGVADSGQPVPQQWLDAHADLDVPALREAITLPSPTPDEQFDAVIATVVAHVRSHLPTASRSPA